MKINEQTEERAVSDTTEVKRSAPRKKKAAAAEVPFEEALARLEAIVKAMEGDAVSLDESLALYEEGIGLVRRCTSELEVAEQKVRILQRTPDGTVEPTEFATTED